MDGWFYDWQPSWEEGKMNSAYRLLKEYQEKTFMSRTLSDSFQGFDYRAYPETAEGINLEKIAVAIKLPGLHSRYLIGKNGQEPQESLRKRILKHLAKDE